MEYKKIVIVGGGVASICTATKLIDNGYPGEFITIIDKGKDAFTRQPHEVMIGFAGCGLYSDGKLTYHTAIGGQLSKYCGEEKAYNLMDQVIHMIARFHPKPEHIMKSDPQSEPDFIKPYFGLRLFPVYHIGTDYLHEIGKRWYQYLLDKGVTFHWQTEIISIDFKEQICYGKGTDEKGDNYHYDTLIFATGKSGIDFAQKLAKDYKLPSEPKSVQIGVRFEAPQKYFQKLIDISYDFKLYQKFEDVSLRSFCTNNNAAYVAVEETYGAVSYNGHAKKGEEFRNDMTNFGIIMEIKGINNPFEWSRNVVNYMQIDRKGGMYYSPGSRLPSTTSEGDPIKTFKVNNLGRFKHALGKYADYITNFIDDMNKVFEFGDDWGFYAPEVKYLNDEVLVKYDDLSLIDYPNVHFAGDSLSARGISVAGSHGIYIAEQLLNTL